MSHLTSWTWNDDDMGLLHPEQVAYQKRVQESFELQKQQVELLAELVPEVKRIADFFQMFIDAWEEADDESRTRARRAGS